MRAPRKPRGAGAVMADHAPDQVEGDTPLQKLHRALNYFATPPWAARAACELVKRLDPAAETCWEPACGEGHFVHGASDYFRHVFATDIHDHGSSLQHGEALDFLSPAADVFTEADWIVTNPPFSLASEFVCAGLRRARRGVAVLCRSGWLEGQGRCELFFPADARPAYALEGVFFERVPMVLGGWDPGASTATPYSVFLFLQPRLTPLWLREMREALGPASACVPIPPGTKARLTHPDDARRFGRAVAMPLFDGGGE